MSTTDGTGPDEPRYGRRHPQGAQPPSYGPGSGEPAQGGQPGTYPQHPGGYAPQPGGYAQHPGYNPPAPYGQPTPGGHSQPGYGHQQYGVPGYGPQQPGGYLPGGYGQPTGPRPKRTGPVIAIVVGILLMLGAPIASFVMAFASATDSLGDIATEGAQLTNGGSVTLPANVERMVIFEASNVSAGAHTCDVVDPGGRSLPVTQTTDAFGQEDIPLPGVTFRTTSAGSYTITCDLPSGVNQSLIITPPLDFGSLVGSGVTVLIGLALGFVGFVLLIIGIVWLVRVNKRIRTGQY